MTKHIGEMRHARNANSECHFHIAETCQYGAGTAQSNIRGQEHWHQLPGDVAIAKRNALNVDSVRDTQDRGDDGNDSRQEHETDSNLAAKRELKVPDTDHRQDQNIKVES